MLVHARNGVSVCDCGGQLDRNRGNDIAPHQPNYRRKNMRRITCMQTMAALWALVLTMFLTAPAAQAGLTIDLRIPTGDPKGLVAVTPGQRVPIDVYAVVTGTSTGVEGLGSLQGAFIGTGNFVTGRIVPAGDLDEATFTITLPAISPFNGNGSQPGASKHIGPA